MHVAFTGRKNKICCENITQRIVENSLCNNPEERSSHPLQSGSLKSRNICCRYRHYVCQFNPLTSELNPSTQRCLTNFLLGILLLEPCILLIYVYAWKTNKCNNYLFSLLIAYGRSYIFGIKLPSSGSVPSAFWEMLNWGAVDRILWMGVGTRNAPWRWYCNAETCRSYHT
jgi:hypothetical protein